MFSSLDSEEKLQGVPHSYKMSYGDVMSCNKVIQNTQMSYTTIQTFKQVLCHSDVTPCVMFSSTLWGVLVRM